MKTALRYALLLTLLSIFCLDASAARKRPRKRAKKNAAEAVAQSFGKGLYVALLFHIVELLIERDAFRCTRDIVVWEKQFEIRLDLAIGREILGFIVVCFGI